MDLLSIFLGLIAGWLIPMPSFMHPVINFIKSKINMSQEEDTKQVTPTTPAPPDVTPAAPVVPTMVNAPENNRENELR